MTERNDIKSLYVDFLSATSTTKTKQNKKRFTPTYHILEYKNKIIKWYIDSNDNISIVNSNKKYDREIVLEDYTNESDFIKHLINKGGGKNEKRNDSKK